MGPGSGGQQASHCMRKKGRSGGRGSGEPGGTESRRGPGEGGGTGSRSEFGPPRARVGAFGGHSVVRVLDFGGIGIR